MNMAWPGNGRARQEHQMSHHAWISLAVTLAVLVVLQTRRNVPADFLFLAGLMVVTLTGVITPADAFAGFSNEAVITIGALLVVAAALRSTGVLDWVGNRLLGSAGTAKQATFRLTFAITAISAFIINTAVVAMFVPVVLDWCRRRGVSPSRLLIPVSYLAILGGTCALIGTSTNILVNGLLAEFHSAEQDRIERGTADYKDLPGFHRQLRTMTLFEIGQVGLPCTIIGAAYLLLIGRRLLPNRTDLIDQFDEQRREYLVEMLVQPECRMIGKTVQQAGLRHLRGLFLVEITRGEDVITPVTPNDVVRSGDRLIFTGVVTTIVDLEKIPGLVPAADTAYEAHPIQRRQRHLTEAVLSNTSPLTGVTVRQADFRQRYNAAVVAVHRNGERLPTKIGDIVLQAGDTLLLQTRTDFTNLFRHSCDFYLVSDVEGSEPRRHDRAWPAVALVVVMIAWLSATPWLAGIPSMRGFSSTAVAGIVIAGLMIAFRCLKITEVRSAIDLHLLITIAAALGLGLAMKESGAARAIADLIVETVGSDNPYLLLIALYLVTVFFTEMISNNAVAVMLFPLAVAIAYSGGYSPRPFIMAILLAASMSFLTPIGYQSNLMVMGPGGYRPRDYLRVGWPLALLVGVTALSLIPIVWPFALSTVPHGGGGL